jgi:hypothetical protein
MVVVALLVEIHHEQRVRQLYKLQLETRIGLYKTTSLSRPDNKFSVIHQTNFSFTKSSDSSHNFSASVLDTASGFALSVI